MNGKPLADESAERDAAVGESPDFERVGQRENIAAELVDRIVAVGRIGCSVASGVETKDAIVLQEVSRLRVPQAVIEAERMREHQRRLVVASFQAVEQASVVYACEGHVRSPSVQRVASETWRPCRDSRPASRAC